MRPFAYLLHSVLLGVLLGMLLLPNVVKAQATPLTFVHVNDLHSRFNGLSPTFDYSPLSPNDDSTLGGWARIATYIKQVKAERQHQVIGLSAGDLSMGSLFHLPIRQTGFEFNLLRQIGIDVTTLGNHEFDLGPDGLAQILNAAAERGPLPEIVYSNIQFAANDSADDSLQAAFKQLNIAPYILKKVNGVTLGIFGMMGIDASEVAPFAKPVTFSDPIQSAQAIVKQLQAAGAEVIIYLSHSGIWDNPAQSEDELMAKAVPEIDLIISGHTSKPLLEPLQVGNTTIVHAGEYGAYAGTLDFVYQQGKLKLTNYQLKQIDDQIPGDLAIQQQIQHYVLSEVEPDLQAKHQLSVEQIVAHSDFSLYKTEQESPLGNLITDAIRWYANQFVAKDDPVLFSIESNGLIRDNLLAGKTGNLSVSDIFSVLPLGIGADQSMAYPLVSFYVNASEVKDALEILTTVAPLKSSDFSLQVSGLRFTYNPNRMLFDRVTQIEQGDQASGFQPLDYSSDNPRLYRVTANIYNTTLLSLIEGFTKGILVITPKDKHGQPIATLADAIVDINTQQEGTQEAKQWVALVEYLRQLPDTDHDGLANIPARYRQAEGRIQTNPSWSPQSLLSNAKPISWLALGVLTVIVFLVAWLLFKLIRRLKRQA